MVDIVDVVENLVAVVYDTLDWERIGNRGRCCYV